MDFVHSPEISRASGNSTSTHEKGILSAVEKMQEPGLRVSSRV